VAKKSVLIRVNSWTNFLVSWGLCGLKNLEAQRRSLRACFFGTSNRGPRFNEKSKEEIGGILGEKGGKTGEIGGKKRKKRKISV
jgi:hypothetical protein